MIKERKQMDRTLKNWKAVSNIVSTIHTKKHYNSAVNLLDKLIDDINIKSDPIKEQLIDTLGTLIKDYEDRNIKEPKSDPIGNLKYLLQEHGLKQSDLSDVGSQGVISEILNGNRKLNLRQIIALCKRFSVSPNVFIETER